MSTHPHFLFHVFYFNVYFNVYFTLFISRYLLHVADLYEVFGNLYCVQCGTLSYLVAAEPECEAVFVREVLADASHIDIVFSGSVERHRIDKFVGIVL